MKGGRFARVVVGLAVGMTFALLAAAPVGAWQAEGDSLNCGSFIGYVHARFDDSAALTGPGGSPGYYVYGDGLWHVQEQNGSYSGAWQALGDPYLDLAATHAGCRNYG